MVKSSWICTRKLSADVLWTYTFLVSQVYSQINHMDFVCLLCCVVSCCVVCVVSCRVMSCRVVLKYNVSTNHLVIFPLVSSVPVNGGFTQWSAWTDCTKTCGGGSQTRTRICTSPVTLNGGTDCSAASAETRACNTGSCGGNVCLLCMRVRTFYQQIMASGY